MFSPHILLMFLNPVFPTTILLLFTISKMLFPTVLTYLRAYKEFFFLCYFCIVILFLVAILEGFTNSIGLL